MLVWKKKKSFLTSCFDTYLHNVLCKIYYFLLNSLASGRFRGFRKKKRLNARGFAWEFLRSCMLYKPGKTLKRRGKSSSLHSKNFFCLGVAVFL